MLTYLAIPQLYHVMGTLLNPYFIPWDGPTHLDREKVIMTYLQVSQ